jgi:hypothetical protein
MRFLSPPDGAFAKGLTQLKERIRILMTEQVRAPDVEAAY